PPPVRGQTLTPRLPAPPDRPLSECTRGASWTAPSTAPPLPEKSFRPGEDGGQQNLASRDPSAVRPRDFAGTVPNGRKPFRWPRPAPRQRTFPPPPQALRPAGAARRSERPGSALRYAASRKNGRPAHSRRNGPARRSYGAGGRPPAPRF